MASHYSLSVYDADHPYKENVIRLPPKLMGSLIDGMLNYPVEFITWYVKYGLAVEEREAAQLENEQIIKRRNKLQ